MESEREAIQEQEERIERQTETVAEAAVRKVLQELEATGAQHSAKTGAVEASEGVILATADAVQQWQTSRCSAVAVGQKQYSSAAAVAVGHEQQ